MERREGKRLTKGNERMIAGVASGLAEYFQVDPTIVRVLWVVLTVFGMPFSLVAYIVLAVVMPSPAAEGPRVVADVTSALEGPAPERDRNVLVFGAVLIVVGVVLAMQSLSWLAWIGWGLPHVLLPVLLIAAGGFLLLRRMNGN